MHALNNEFASEHEKQQRELHLLQAKMKQFNEAEAKGCEACRTLTDQVKHGQGKLVDVDDQNKRLHGKIELLTDDNYMLKVLVSRLNAQLESCQQTLRTKNVESTAPKLSGRCVNAPTMTTTATSATMDNVLSIDWTCLQGNVLIPLLNAYHETIAEKSSLIQQYDGEMIRIAGHLKDITANNEQMYVDMEQLRRKSDDWLTEKTRLQAQLDAYRLRLQVTWIFECVTSK